MPVLKRKDGEIHYEEYGQGYPVLLFAPGGMRSRAEMWHAPAGRPAAPWSDWTQSLAAAPYRVIAMDQRNAGRSRTAIEADHGWHTYAADHFALMDHLGLYRFHTLGGCIGSSFCLKLCEIGAQPDQRRGVAEPDRPATRTSGAIFPRALSTGAKEQKAERPRARRAKIAAFGENMWNHRLRLLRQPRVLRNAARCRRCLLPGIDKPHPAVTFGRTGRVAAGHRDAERTGAARSI